MKRIVFVDYIRMIACFLVMLVHASECFYCSGADQTLLVNEANRFWVAFYDGGLGRTCVPLFMVISAFLLVPMKPGVTMSEFYQKRFKRILPPFAVFMVLYAILPYFFGWTDYDQMVTDVTHLPLNFPSIAGPLWFIFPLISLYLIIPVVSPWLEKASAKDEKIFIGLFVASTFIPWIHRFISPEIWGECFWNEFDMLWYCSGYLGYLVLAHYIRFHLDWNRSKRIGVGLACALVGGVFTGWSFWMKAVPGVEMYTPDAEWAWGFCTPNVLLGTFGMFLLFTCIQQKKAPTIVTDIAKYSYGMYLMHYFWLIFISNLVIGGDVANPLLPVSLAIPVIAILTYVCSLITTSLIMRIPGGKWIVG